MCTLFTEKCRKRQNFAETHLFHVVCPSNSGTTKKGGFSKGGFSRVQCHDQGNKTIPRLLGPAVRLALRAPQPREAYSFLQKPTLKTSLAPDFRCRFSEQTLLKMTPALLPGIFSVTDTVSGSHAVPLALQGGNMRKEDVETSHGSLYHSLVFLSLLFVCKVHRDTKQTSSLVAPYPAIL